MAAARMTARLKSYASRSVPTERDVAGYVSTTGFQHLSGSRVQFADDGGDVIFLEEADGGDAGGAGLQAEMSILQRYSSEGEDWNLGATGLAEGFETSGCGSGCVFFFEDGGEDGEGGLSGSGLSDLFWGVTGDCDQGIAW